jgi:hypothetical protein
MPRLAAARRLLPPALGVGLPAVAYLATLLPGVGYHPDSARFQLVGAVLGTPHYTGYPTYTVLDHLFVSALPWGRIAWRANLLSALFAAAALAFLWALLRRLAVTPWPAAAAVACFGLTPLFWSQAIVAEVYTLHLLLVSAVCWLLVRWRQGAGEHNLYLAIAVYALSFGNHLLTLALLPAVLYLVWATDRRVFASGRKIAWTVAWIALGALQYAYLVWRSRDPATPYLYVYTPDLPALADVVTGGANRGRMFAFSAGELLGQRLPLAVRELWASFGLLLVPAGVGVARLGTGVTQRFLALAFLAPLAVALCYDIPDVQVYLLPSWLVVAIYLGLGLGVLAGELPRRLVRWAPLLLLAPPLALAGLHWQEVDQSDNRQLAEQVEATLETVGEDAVILPAARSLAPAFSYYLLVERWQRRHNLWITWPAAALERYLDGGPAPALHQRRLLPAGLAPFVMLEEQARQLAGAGGADAGRAGVGDVAVDRAEVDRAAAAAGHDDAGGRGTAQAATVQDGAVGGGAVRGVLRVERRRLTLFRLLRSGEPAAGVATEIARRLPSQQAFYDASARRLVLLAADALPALVALRQRSAPAQARVDAVCGWSAGPDAVEAVRSGPPLEGVDEIPGRGAGGTPRPAPKGRQASAVEPEGPSSGWLLLEGWAVDAVARRPAGGVWVELDGRLYAASYGWERGDVAAYFEQPAYRRPGFKALLPAPPAGGGSLHLRLHVLAHDGESYFTTEQDLPPPLTPPAEDPAGGAPP